MTGPPAVPPQPTAPRPVPPGRPSQLTPELQAKIVQVVRAGNYLKTAAQYNGVGESTLRLWLQKGRAAAEARDHGEEVPPDQARYLEFLEVITVAQTAAEVAAVTHWRAAFPDDWRAARDYLRATNPGAWASTTRVAISQEEADRRIDAATEQVLVAVGIDTDNLDEGHLAPGELPVVLDDGDTDDEGNTIID